MQHYLNILNYNGSELGSLSVLTNIPEDILKRCDIDGILMIRRSTAFIADIDALNNYNIHPKELEMDVKNEPYENIVIATQEIKRQMQALFPDADKLTAEQVNQVYFNSAPAIIKAYTEQDILQDSITTWWGLIVFFCARYRNFLMHTVN